MRRLEIAVRDWAGCADATPRAVRIVGERCVTWAVALAQVDPQADRKKGGVGLGLAIGRELGVRYVLEGSVRKAADAAARGAIGRRLRPDELNRLVAAYQQLETGEPSHAEHELHREQQPAIESELVCLQLHEIAGHKPRGEAEVAQYLYEQPCAVAAGT